MTQRLNTFNFMVEIWLKTKENWSGKSIYKLDTFLHAERKWVFAKYFRLQTTGETKKVANKDNSPFIGNSVYWVMGVSKYEYNYKKKTLQVIKDSSITGMKLASCTTRDTWNSKEANPGASALMYSEKCILLFNLVFWTEISLELGNGWIHSILLSLSL